MPYPQKIMRIGHRKREFIIMEICQVLQKLS